MSRSKYKVGTILIMANDVVNLEAKPVRLWLG